jgi:ribosomal protein S18 acetylase RimI-like enzyme
MFSPRTHITQNVDGCNKAHLAEVEFRDCSEADFSEISQMEADYYKEVDPTEAYDEKRFHDEFWEAIRDPRKKIMVAHVNGMFAGFIWLEEYDEPDGTLGYINNIHVAKGYRNRGIAKRLLSRAEEHFKGRNVKRLQLEVVEGNKTAMSLYVKNGYRLTRYDAMKNEFTPAGDYLEKNLT